MIKSLLSLTVLIHCFAFAHWLDSDRVPSLIHLALDTDASHMQVSWYTQSKTNFSVVLYGTTSGKYQFSASGTMNTYQKEVGYFHDVLLTNLKSSTTYYYIVGDNSTKIYSQEYSFISAMAPGDFTKPFKVAMYGDLGAEYSNGTIARLNEAAVSDDIQLVIHAGDISYADDYDNSYFEYIWSKFFDVLQPLMTKIPYNTAVGNNDYSCENNKKKRSMNKKDLLNFNKNSKRQIVPACGTYSSNWTTYLTRFRMPFEASKSPSGMFYSFNYGPVHFIAMSTESSFPGSPFNTGDDHIQLRWLENDLIEANKNRNKRPWIVMFGHRPMYSSIIIYNDYFSPIGNCLILQQAFEPLLLKYNVDIFLVGHVHGYESLWPIYDSSNIEYSFINPNYTVHIVSGSTGDIEGMDPKIAYSPVTPRWSRKLIVGADEISPYDWTNSGYGVMTFVNRTNLVWQFFSSADNTLWDQFEIVKNH